MKRKKLMDLLKEIKNGEDFIYNEEKNLIIVFNDDSDYADVYNIKDDEKDFTFEKSQWRFCTE